MNRPTDLDLAAVRANCTPDRPILRVSAYAKVNLSLEILGRRADGFHEIASVTQVISLADSVEASSVDAMSVEMIPNVVDPAENLVGVAARALATATGREPEAALSIRKRIPLAAGLGGGSSDAAAALRLLDRLWETRLRPQQLAEIAATLGSDVPLFLGAGTSLIQGRGESVTSLPAVQPFWLLLICPGNAPAEKTRALYGALRPDEFGTGATTLTLAERITAGQPIEDAALVNSFDGAASRIYPGFPDLRQRLQRAIGRSVHLTGAGPTLFATFRQSIDARTAARQVSRFGVTTFVARSIARRPSIRAICAKTDA